MAGFVALQDPDPARRRAFLDAARADLGLPGFDLPVETITAGDAACAYVAGTGAHAAHGGEDGAALILGVARQPDGRRVAPREMLRAWWGPGATEAAPPACADGYHAWVALGPDGALAAGADLLGLFPVHVLALDDVLLVASHPTPLRHHPAFAPRLDEEGLAGLLLVNAPVDGRTLWRDVRRLEAGTVVWRRPPGAARSVRQFAPPLEGAEADAPFETRVEAAGAAVEDALWRHAPPGTTHEVLLSGGLDSRLLAGLLARQGTALRAATLGRPQDLEVRCAARVARALGIEHEVREAGDVDPDRQLDLAVEREHLVQGTAGLLKWGETVAGPPPPGPVVCGHVFDAVLGPHGWVDTARDPRPVFDQVLGALSNWGFPPATLETLLRPDVFGDAVRSAVARLRARFDALADDDFVRAHALYLQHRQRHYVASHLWPRAFFQEVVAPVLDRSLLETVLPYPEDVLMERRLERALLARHLPRLAALPAERTSLDTRPYAPGPLSRATWWAIDHVRPVRRLRRAWLERRGEARQARRIADPDRPFWRRLRARVEPHRPLGHALFAREAFDALWPPPEKSLSGAPPIYGRSGAKNLGGVLRWLAVYGARMSR